MKLSRAVQLSIALWVVAVPIVNAQDKGSSTPLNDYPVYQLVFKPAPPITPLRALALFSPPVLCAQDGTAYFGSPEPPTYLERTVYSLNSTEQRVFTYRDLQELHEPHFRGFFPGVSATFVLVNATQDSDPSLDTVMPKGAVSPSEDFADNRHDFLLKFENSGRFLRAIQLPDELRFYRFAELEDGSFVAMGIDRASAAARLSLLTSDGKIVRDLPPPPGLAVSSNLPEGKIADRRALAAASSRLTTWFFAPVRHKVLLYATGIDAPVLEISPDGVTREVQIAVPKGFSIDGFVSSNDLWLVRYARKIAAEFGKPVIRRSANGDYFLYEVDFNDGRFRRELSMASIPNLGIACEQGGMLTGYSFSRDSKYIPFTASLPQ